jgi:peptidoglycan/LPS O-acetylase OafA/YrhL
VTLAAVDKYYPELNLSSFTLLAIAIAVYAPLIPVSYAFFKIIERPSIRLGELVWTKTQPVQNRASVGTA